VPDKGGLVLSRYEIRREIGRGGIGVVYEARDTRLNRTVAIKILQEETDDAQHRRRFKQEAEAASALNHPNIITVHDIDAEGDVDYIVMEYVDGVPLSALIAERALPVSQAVGYAVEIAGALAAAHSAGIVHRDLKPANIMVTRGDRIKVLDFGLSKLARAVAAPGQATVTTVMPHTGIGVVVGTIGYMSPEQATGEPIDARSDVFSFGVVFYEMLTGRRAFPGDSYPSVLRAILQDDPPPVTETRPDAHPDLQRILERCLAKDPANRYPSAVELAVDLAATLARPASGIQQPRTRRSRRTVIAAAVAVVAILAAIAIPLYRWQAQRSRAAALREIQRSIEAGRYGRAYGLARDLERKMPRDAEIRRALERVTGPANIRTTPPVADIFFKDYGVENGTWQFFGKSPIEKTRAPVGVLHWRVLKPGFEPVEGRFWWSFGRTVTLHSRAATPSGMVYLPAGPGVAAGVQNPDLGACWIGAYEVTNREFKTFVDRGGYREPRYWRHPFSKDNQPLTWAQAMALFVDRTGRPGPATWEAGTYPTDRADYPVSGVSWYEAAAFAEFAGKSLPTIYHWQKAGGPLNLRQDVTLGNFSGQGPRAVLRLNDLGPYGTYGLAGNVKEWTSSGFEGQRYILGGAWNEPPYMVFAPDARPPFDRSDRNGFRCARYVTPPDAALTADVEMRPRHPQMRKPVDDAVFDAYRSFYSYDRTPVDARVERVQETEHWRQERVSFAAAYGRERVIAHLLLPKNAAPPFQSVIWWPGSYALQLDSSEPLNLPYYFDFLPKSGRAVVYPVYAGMYERHAPGSGRQPRGIGTAAYRDIVIQWSKDLGRTIDYLETRRDIDREKIAFYIFSMGGTTMPVPAMEPRLKTIIFLSAGLPRRSLDAAIDPVNFAPRLKKPLLLIGGRYDFLSPLESSQVPLFKLFGTPERDKRHAVFNSGHVPERLDMIRDVLDWLDRQLGPVKTR
jgi:predicted Ser/Thr protein kinase/dienelactone hydrolase